MSFGERPTAKTIACVLIASACAAGCAPGPEPSTTTIATPPQTIFPNWPNALNDFRFHWSAAPGVDLTTVPASVVRAYLDSYRIVGLTGGDMNNAYPGFLQSTPDNSTEGFDPLPLHQLTGVRPKTQAGARAHGWEYPKGDVYGYQPTYLLSLEPRGDQVRATVCVGEYATYRTESSGKLVSIIAKPESGELQFGDWQLVEVWRIELTDKDSRSRSQPAPGGAQSGPNPAPVDDVFGPWFITGASTGLWGLTGSGETIDTPEVRQACGNAMPDDAATRKAMATGFHDKPPPPGDPVPGWPAANE